MRYEMEKAKYWLTMVQAMGMVLLMMDILMRRNHISTIKKNYKQGKKIIVGF
jgi:hypothetical protein